MFRKAEGNTGDSTCQHRDRAARTAKMVMKMRYIIPAQVISQHSGLCKVEELI
jgi:hypothetical protein